VPAEGVMVLLSAGSGAGTGLAMTERARQEVRRRVVRYILVCGSTIIGG